MGHREEAIERVELLCAELASRGNELWHLDLVAADLRRALDGTGGHSLGGHSLGGHLADEVARLRAENDDLRARLSRITAMAQVYDTITGES